MTGRPHSFTAFCYKSWLVSPAAWCVPKFSRVRSSFANSESARRATEFWSEALEVCNATCERLSRQTELTLHSTQQSEQQFVEKEKWISKVSKIM